MLMQPVRFSSYNNRMADTLFERLPLRQFVAVTPEIVEEELIEEVETEEPVRGLWKTTADGELIEIDGQTYEENTSHSCAICQPSEHARLGSWFRW